MSGHHKSPLIRKTSQVSARINPSAAFHSPCRMYNDGLNRSDSGTIGSRQGVGRGTNAGTFCSQREYASGKRALIFARSFSIVGPYTSAKNATTSRSNDQWAAIANPAAMRKLPK